MADNQFKRRNLTTGYTFTEVMVVAAIIGIIAVSSAKLIGILGQAKLRAESMQLLRMQSSRVLRDIEFDINRMGHNINIIEQTEIIMRKDPLSAGCSTYYEILFFASDEDNDGNMNQGDIWIRFATATVNGEAVLQRYEYENPGPDGTYTNIVDTTTVPNIYHVEPVSIINLTNPGIAADEFKIEFFTSSSAETSINDPRNASTALITLTLRRHRFKFTASRLILLHNILYGLQYR